MMKKKSYIEPMTQVFVLQQQHHLLAGSNPAASSAYSSDGLGWSDTGISDGDR